MNNSKICFCAVVLLLTQASLGAGEAEDRAFQQYLGSVDRAVARKVDAILANWQAITPEILQQSENAEAVVVIREIAKAHHDIGAEVLMLNLGDSDITAMIIGELHGDSTRKRRNAYAILERCSQPKIIPLIADDLFRDESTKTTWHWVGNAEREGITPLSVSVGQLIRTIIKNSSVFGSEVKSWAASVQRERYTSRDATREALRIWWTQNGDLIKAEKYDLVKAGPSVAGPRATALSCQDASAPYGGIVTLSATLTDSSLPNHPAITGKSLAFAVAGKSISNPYEAWLAPGTHPVTVSFAGDSSYGASNATCQLTVQSSPGKITGGGSIGPGQRSFSFVSQTKTKDSAVSYTGNCTFKDASQNIDLKAVEITGMAVAADRIHGTFVATATNNGAPGFTTTVYLEDRVESGVGADKFHLQVSGPNGFSYDSAPQDEGDKVLTGGNIQIHKPN